MKTQPTDEVLELFKAEPKDFVDFIEEKKLECFEDGTTATEAMEIQWAEEYLNQQASK